MSFIRRKSGQVLLVHNEREPETGRVRQRELHRFGSVEELSAALTPAGWQQWTRTISWRERELSFDWPALRARLTAELTQWQASPAGSKHRRNGKIERLASELVADLATLSLAQAADAALIAQIRPALLGLQDAIGRLLPVETHRKGPMPMERETTMTEIAEWAPNEVVDEAGELFDAGMEHWWNGDRRKAATWFRKALAVDPLHADAHNHLGLIKYDAHRWLEAEQHFRTAIKGGERHIVKERRKVDWGWLENRPYLRALANMALVQERQRRWPEALTLNQQLLELNPADHQGVRYLLGPLYLRVGDVEAAIKHLRRIAAEEVGSAFCLALACLRAGRPEAVVGEALLTGFALNGYLAPMLLAEPWQRLDAYHGTNMREPEWADDAREVLAPLWQETPESAAVLRQWWLAPEVVAWRRDLDGVMVQLKNAPVGPAREVLVAQWSRLESREKVSELVATVMERRKLH